jgi:site-specific DNA recombinase
MRVAAYVRVSTPGQVKLQSIEQQLETIYRYTQDKGWELPEENIFRDDGYSGASLDRPALDVLRDKVRIRELDVVVVLSPDRLARNYVHQMVLIEELEKGGCQVEFVERPISSEPNDQLLLQIRGAVAEYERTLIKERMRRGKLAKLKAGLLLPWTHTPYGYRADPDRPRDPAGVRLDEEKAAVVAEIFAMYLEEGMSLCGVSKKLRARGIRSPRGGEVWTVSSLRWILTNPVYTGRVYAGRMRHRPPRIRRSATHPIGRPSNTAVPVAPEEWIPVATVPAIVTQEQFDLAKEKLSKNKAFASRNNKRNTYLLRALVSCGRCKLACSARALRNSKYYVCAGKKKQIQTGRGENCPSRYAPAEQLDELVWRDLCEVLAHPESMTEALQRAHGGGWLPQELKARRENLREGRATLKRQLDRLTEAYLGEVIPLAEYRRRRQDLEQRDRALAGQQRQLQDQAARRMELAGVVSSIEDFCARVQSGLQSATFEQKRSLVELLIDRVIVTDEEVEIRYVIPTDPSSEQTRFCHLRTDYCRDLRSSLQHPPACTAAGGLTTEAMEQRISTEEVKITATAATTLKP